MNQAPSDWFPAGVPLTASNMTEKQRENQPHSEWANIGWPLSSNLSVRSALVPCTDPVS